VILFFFFFVFLDFFKRTVLSPLLLTRSRRHYLRPGASTRYAHTSCIARAGTAPAALSPTPSLAVSEKCFVLCGHPEDWAVSVTELMKSNKDTQPINDVLLWKVAAAVGDLKKTRCAAHLHNNTLQTL
jgi:hypothetical protein